MVSACLMGKDCKYNGGNNRNGRVIECVSGHEVVEVCPELLAGLGCPRAPIEIVRGVLMTRDGQHVDAACREGMAAAVRLAREAGIDLAILQSRSPTCGVNQVYDGTFSGKLIPGRGIFAAALDEAGIKAVDAEEI